MAGVAQTRRAGLGDECDVPGLKSGEQLWRATAHVVFVVAKSPGVDAVLAQQDPSRPSVFRGDEPDLTKKAERPNCGVLEVTDRRGDDEQTAQRI